MDRIVDEFDYEDARVEAAIDRADSERKYRCPQCHGKDGVHKLSCSYRPDGAIRLSMHGEP